MIRKLRVAVTAFVAAYLPPHLRLPNRTALFNALLEPFRNLEGNWIGFRDSSTIAANVTGETASLQWYLNYLYDTSAKRIVIETAPPSGTTAGLVATEPTLYIVAGLPNETGAVIGLPGESPVFGSFDFIIKRPASIATQDAGITKTTHSYRAAGKLFKIVNS